MKENFAGKIEFYQPKIKIIGVGGCGCRAVNTMIESKISGADFFVIDADEKILSLSKLDEQHKIQIGEKLTNGLGLGGNPTVGERAALEELENKAKIKEIVKDTDILLIINGVAGGSAGAVPVIAQAAKEQGTVNIVFAVTPWHLEGKRKAEYSEKALKKFTEEEKNIDSVINVSNERFADFADKQSTLNDVFNWVNVEISKCIEAIVNIFRKTEYFETIRFKDFKEFIKNVGFTGIGISKKHNFDEQNSAIEEIINYPLIKGSFEYAEKAVINIKVGKNLTLHFVHEIVSEITNEFNNKAEVFLGVQTDKDTLSANEFEITVITA